MHVNQLSVRSHGENHAAVGINPKGWFPVSRKFDMRSRVNKTYGKPLYGKLNVSKRK